jgi:hypothetical protein
MFASTILKATSLESLRESCGYIYMSGAILMPSPQSKCPGLTALSSPSSTDVFYIFLYLPACHPLFVVAHRIWNALPLPTT